jgi:predicted deacylase
VVPSDLTLDLHSALDGCDIAPFVYIDPYDNEEGTLELRERVGTAFGTPFVYHKARGEKLGTSDMTRALRNQASLKKRPSLSAEMGESRRVSWEHIPMAKNGLQNSMRAFGVLEGDVAPPPKQRVFTKITLVHAEHGGGLRMPVKLGQDVKKGEELATIVDVFGETVERAVSPIDGFVLRKMLFGSVATGGELAWIGS